MPVSTELKHAFGNPDRVEEILQRRRRARMTEIDRLPPDIRHLVHEYGWSVVHQFMLCGVKRANHIRHLVETVLNEFSPTRGTRSAQGSFVAHGIDGDAPIAQRGDL